MTTVTTSQAEAQLRKLGMKSGAMLLVHTSFRKVGPLDGGPLGLTVRGERRPLRRVRRRAGERPSIARLLGIRVNMQSRRLPFRLMMRRVDARDDDSSFTWMVNGDGLAAR